MRCTHNRMRLSPAQHPTTSGEVKPTAGTATKSSGKLIT